ncbi:hypothetical protein VKT23_014779 [Stygiomarasmius scandens]|uniref:DNA helicase n=1 Tax=Marasmiellus scandens TaxID=2682957 RepID=A0ABR1J143_9AGAR
MNLGARVTSPVYLHSYDIASEDVALLKTRLASRVQPDWSSKTWATAPLVVSENAVKDAANVEAVKAFAMRTGRPLHWYYASHTHSELDFGNAALREKLCSSKTTNSTKYMGKLPLVVGMPVIITSNFDVGNGVVNGTHGILKKIRYRMDGTHRHATSCVVQAFHSIGSPMSNLTDMEIPVVEQESEVYYIHPYNGRKLAVSRMQVPILPAFAITCHKAQGRTLDSVVVDLMLCRGSESPYVMLSRAKTLDSVVVLRCRLSEDLRVELRRIQILELQTIMRYAAIDEERSEAQSQLQSIYSMMKSPVNYAHITQEELLPVTCNALNKFCASADVYNEAHRILASAEGSIDGLLDSELLVGPEKIQKRRGGVDGNTSAPARKRRRVNVVEGAPSFHVSPHPSGLISTIMSAFDYRPSSHNTPVIQARCQPKGLYDYIVNLLDKQIGKGALANVIPGKDFFRSVRPGTRAYSFVDRNE